MSDYTNPCWWDIDTEGTKHYAVVEGRAYWGTGKSRIKAKLAAQLLADILPVVAAWQFRGQWYHEVIEPRGGP